MKLRISNQTPFGVHICQYLYDLDSNFAKEDKSLPLHDIIAHVLYATKRIRMGNEPIPQEAIDIIKTAIESNAPIPISCVFGNEESPKEDLDISELQSLQTLKDINDRVKSFYDKGLDIRLQVTGTSQYTMSVIRLATILGGFIIGAHEEPAITVSFANYRDAHYYYKSIPSKNILRGGWIAAWDGKGYLSVESPHEIVSMMTSNTLSDLISTTLTLENNGLSVDLIVDYLM